MQSLVVQASQIHSISEGLGGERGGGEGNVGLQIKSEIRKYVRYGVTSHDREVKTNPM